MNQPLKDITERFPEEDWISNREVSKANMVSYFQYRKDFHINHAGSDKTDIDVLVMESGALGKFIQNFYADPLEASLELAREAYKQAEKLAKDDADEATYEDIIYEGSKVSGHAD